MANGTMCEGCIFQPEGHNQGRIPLVQNDPLSWRCIFNHERVTLCNNSKFIYPIYVVTVTKGQSISEDFFLVSIPPKNERIFF